MLLLPIIANGHWTLLAVQRKAPAPLEEAALTVGGPKHAGCAKCEWNIETGCLSCDPDKYFKWGHKVKKELSFLQPLTGLTPLPNCADWDVRYYDSLPHAHEGCAKVAHALLDGLQQVGVPLRLAVNEMAMMRGHRVRQTDLTSCGWFVLHFMEVEFRRFLGEGMWPVAYSVTQRVELLGPWHTRFAS